jgi:hypothetical protein
MTLVEVIVLLLDERRIPMGRCTFTQVVIVIISMFLGNILGQFIWNYFFR